MSKFTVALHTAAEFAVSRGNSRRVDVMMYCGSLLQRAHS